MEKQTKVKRRFRNDVIFVAVLLSATLLIGASVYLFSGRGNVVTVTVDGEVYGVYRLDRDITEDIITGESGEYFNRLIIKDGKAFVEEASCPDGICSSHKPILRNGESIVCLPNRVVVTVTTEIIEDSPDILV